MSRPRSRQPRFARFRPLLEAALRRALSRGEDTELQRMVRYHLGYADARGRPVRGQRGKGVRATLCFLACKAVDGQPAAAAPAAAALARVHSLPHLHHDIMDQDELRHGRPTVWRRWGEARAIAAGDALFALANLALADLDPRRVAPQTIASIVWLLNQAVLEVCEGQALDLVYQGRADVTRSEYLAMVSLKTGSLLRAAAAIGAAVGGGGERALAGLGSFGAHLGAAYQIRDDLLGLWGDPGRLGKPVGSDLRQNKRSLPIVLALSEGSEQLRARLHQALGQGGAGAEEAAALAQIMEREGIREACELLARQQIEEALSWLARAGGSAEGEAELREFAEFLAARAY